MSDLLDRIERAIKAFSAVPPNEDGAAEPMDRSREFEKQFTVDAGKLTPESAEKLKAELNESDSFDKTLVKKYCALITHHRRNRDFNKCAELFDAMGSKISDPFWPNHLNSIVLKNSGESGNLGRAINLARSVLELEPRHAGALHNLAGCLLLKAKSDHVEPRHRTILLDESLESIDLAIGLDPGYAKFYATRADILGSLKYYDRANASLRKAIDLEDSGQRDYALRIADYLFIKASLEIDRRLDSSVKSAERSIKDSLNSANRSNIEVLTLFIAAIAFIITTIRITPISDLSQFVAIIFLLFSSLLLTISAFSTFFASTRPVGRFMLSLLMSAVIAGLGLAVKYFW